MTVFVPHACRESGSHPILLFPASYLVHHSNGIGELSLRLDGIFHVESTIHKGLPKLPQYVFPRVFGSLTQLGIWSPSPCLLVEQSSRNRSAPQCRIVKLFIVDGPEDGLSPNIPRASASGSTRIAEYSRHVVVMPCCSSKIAGRVTKNCPTLTDFENSASRYHCPQPLNPTDIFLKIEYYPFLDARLNNSTVSCLVSFVTRSRGMLRSVCGETLSPSLVLKIPSQNCCADTELIDCVSVSRIFSSITFEKRLSTFRKST